MLRSVWFKLIRILITNSIILIAFPLQAVCNSLLLILLLLLLVLFQLTYPITIIRLVLIAISLLWLSTTTNNIPLRIVSWLFRIVSTSAHGRI